jgi:hypothetical protein
MGECWHKDIDGFVCKCNCGFIGIYQADKWQHQNQSNNDFSTWQGFGKLWEWVQKKNSDCEEYEEWAQHFLFSLQVHCLSIGYYVHVIPESVIGPDAFADALYEFLKEELCP